MRPIQGVSGAMKRYVRNRRHIGLTRASSWRADIKQLTQLSCGTVHIGFASLISSFEFSLTDIGSQQIWRSRSKAIQYL